MPRRCVLPFRRQPLVGFYNRRLVEPPRLGFSGTNAKRSYSTLLFAALLEMPDIASMQDIFGKATPELQYIDDRKNP